MARCNEDDWRIARKFKARLEQARKIPDHALRSLGAVADAGRRIARLTLGVSTKNVQVSHDPYAQMSDQELAAALTRLTDCGDAH
ncbi:MAG TPA: hypothetical protein VF772_16630 [Terriglobales bacterium]